MSSSKPAESQEVPIPEVLRDPTTHKVYQKGRFLGKVVEKQFFFQILVDSVTKTKVSFAGWICQVL